MYIGMDIYIYTVCICIGFRDKVYVGLRVAMH